MATVEERIIQFNNNRIPRYVALKYKLMAQDPFRFFRGTCHLFYEDLCNEDNIPVSPLAWICGDLHLENFGSYKADNGLVYFDLNDFDEAILAPVSLELVRITSSIFVALGAIGIRQQGIVSAANFFLQTYASTLSKGKARYIELRTSKGITRLFIDKVSERKQNELLGKRTFPEHGQLMLLVDNKKLFPVEQSLKKELVAHLTQRIMDNEHLRNKYRVADVGFRIAGTGSIGVKRYLFLLQKNGGARYVLIDMKQALPSSLVNLCKTKQPSWATEANRIVAIKQRMQNITPALLSAATFNGESYVIKEMQPTADKINFELIRDQHKDIKQIIEDIAMLTASAQIRSSGRQGSAIADEMIAYGEDSQWQKKILCYAMEYAIKIKKDYLDYLNAYKAGFFTK